MTLMPAAPAALVRALRALVFGILVIVQPLLDGGAVCFSQVSRPERPAGPYLIGLLKSTPIEPSDELRALWVVRDALRNPTAVEQMIDFARQARIHLIFLQVRGRGDAFYRSALSPPGAELEFPISEFDPLEYALLLAREADIAMHAWLNVYYVWSSPDAPPTSHVVRTNPEWFLRDPAGVPMTDRKIEWWQQDGLEGYYLSPSSAEVRTYFADVVAELVDNYAIDGIHLDYVRYPARQFGLDAERRTDFALAWGVDPIALDAQREQITDVLGYHAVARIDSMYTGYRASQVDSLVDAVRGVSRGLPVSAAVFPDPVAARADKGQDWVAWIHERRLDFVVPMMYNYPPPELYERIRTLQRMIGSDRFLVGVALHDGRSIYLPKNVEVVRETRAPGIALFSYNVLADMRFPLAMIADAFDTPADTTMAEPIDEEEPEE